MNRLTLATPYSMNSLFGEFFRNFSGVILGVSETILGVILEVFWRDFGGKTIEKQIKNKEQRSKTLFSLFFTIFYYFPFLAPNSLFTE